MINEREESRQIMAQILDCVITMNYIKKKKKSRIYYDKVEEMKEIHLSCERLGKNLEFCSVIYTNLMR